MSTRTLQDPIRDQSWREWALCAQVGGDLHHPEKGESTRDAKRVCMACDVRLDCLSWALAAGERFGVLGGKSERERRRMINRGEVPTPEPVAPTTGHRPVTVEHKTCTRCHTSKPADGFVRSNRSSDGLDYQCRMCKSETRTRKQVAA